MQTEHTPHGYTINEMHNGLYCWEKNTPGHPFVVDADKGGFATAADAQADAIRHANEPEEGESETDWNAYQHMAFGRGL